MKKIKFFLLSLFILSITNQGFCLDHVDLKDVKPLTEKLFEMHVAETKMTPELMKRSLFLMVQTFDEHQGYLLASERSVYLDISQDALKQSVANYHKGEFTEHQGVLVLIEGAVSRHRELRAVIKQRVLANYERLLEGSVSIRKSKALVTHDDIAGKIEASYLRLIRAKLKERGEERFSATVIESILAFQDRLWFEHEDKLIGAQGRDFLPILLVKNFAKSMDVHSNYYSPEEAAQFRSALNKQMCGIGVVFKRDFDGLYIGEIIKDAPADLSHKIDAGDRVIAVNSKNIAKMYFRDIIRLMKGERGEAITLTLKKANKNNVIQEVTLNRRPIVLNDQRVSSQYVSFGRGGIGLIDFPGFYSNGGSVSAAQDLKKEIMQLQKRGDLRGIVLDMRENGGGFLDQAIKVCKFFMPSGLVAIAKYKDNKVRFMNHIGKKPLYEGPLMILTSKASASAAEIVSQTLQDYGLAIIVGDKEGSFGKGSMQTQTITNEDAEHFFKVTVARYYTASGRSPQVVGVNSDIVVSSQYFPYKVGEKHLTFALSADVLTQDVFHQLQKASGGGWSSSGARAAQVVPYLKPRMSNMRKRLVHLRANSEKRLKKNKNFQYFLKTGGNRSQTNPPAFGSNDLQMKEAEAIIKDLITMQ